jgi:hypothetical protein
VTLASHNVLGTIRLYSVALRRVHRVLNEPLWRWVCPEVRTPTPSAALSIEHEAHTPERCTSCKCVSDTKIYLSCIA